VKRMKVQNFSSARLGVVHSPYRVWRRINGFYNDIELKFKATRGDGQLLWISDEPNVEFLSVRLTDGFVELGYNVGDGDVWMIWRHYRVDDLAWHVVSVKRFV